MLAYALRRLAACLPLALGAATLVFVLMETAPGNPVDVMLGDRPLAPEVRARIASAYGFDRPPLARYGHWLEALVLEGELGWSHARGRPVREALAGALPATLALSCAALALNLVCGLALGLASAVWRGRSIVRWTGWISLALYAMPLFWLALIAILCLSYAAPIFPSSSMQSLDAAGWPWPWRWLDRLWHLALPAGVLGLTSAAATGRFVETGLVSAFRQGFIRAVRARGAGRKRVLAVHALRNSLLPVINLAGLALPMLLSGSLVVEVVFAWPGMGRLTYDAIRAQDFPVVMATTLLATLLVVSGSLVADLLMAAADPRIRLTAGGRR